MPGGSELWLQAMGSLTEVLRKGKKAGTDRVRFWRSGPPEQSKDRGKGVASFCENTQGPCAPIHSDSSPNRPGLELHTICRKQQASEKIISWNGSGWKGP